MNTDGPRTEELVVAGGGWAGVLFENPEVHLPLSLYWSFTFDYQDVERDYGSTMPGLTIDRVALGRRSWRAMGAELVRGERFADPVETSFYFFEHHRFDGVSLRMLEQQGDRLHVTAAAWGDIDGLGIERLAAEAWLRFRGIVVRPAVAPRSVEAARELLEAYTDAGGLVGSQGPHNVEFVPAR